MALESSQTLELCYRHGDPRWEQDTSLIGASPVALHGSKASFGPRAAMALAAAVAAVALVACGGSKSTATTTTTDPQALQKYVTAVRNAVDEAEQKIAVAVDGPDNNY